MCRLFLYIYSIHSALAFRNDSIDFRNYTNNLRNDTIDLRNDNIDLSNDIIDTSYPKGGNTSKAVLIRFEDDPEKIVAMDRSTRNYTIGLFNDTTTYTDDTINLRNDTAFLKGVNAGKALLIHFEDDPENIVAMDWSTATEDPGNYTIDLKDDTTDSRDDTIDFNNDITDSRDHITDFGNDTTDFTDADDTIDFGNDTVYPADWNTLLNRYEDVLAELYALDRATVTNVPYPLQPGNSLKRVKRQKSRRTTTVSPIEKPQAKMLRLKKKVYELMQQSLYASQENLWPVEISLAEYENLSPYRMAFVFGQLQLLTHEAQAIVQQIERQHYNKSTSISPTRRLQIYWVLVRDNIDVSYLIDYLLQRVPKDQVAELRKKILRKEEEDIKKMMAMEKAKRNGIQSTPRTNSESDLDSDSDMY